MSDEGTSLDGAGPYSMLAVSALEGHIKKVELLGREYPAIQWANGTTLTQLMVFCRGLLGYDKEQKVVLRDMMGGGKVVEPGDWIVMASRTVFGVLRLHTSASLFDLMPNVPLSTPEERLSRIAQKHQDETDAHGGVTGHCIECGFPDPCPTYVWASWDRDPLSTWDPTDDEERNDGG